MSEQSPPAEWCLPALAGRLCEFSSPAPSVGLAVSASLILDAQHRGEPAAWVASERSCFFPPDFDAAGVDLAALPVVRVSGSVEAAVAADELLRSGGFSLVVVDLGGQLLVPVPMQTRLAGLAKAHHAALLFLTRKANEAPSLGSLIGIRATGTIERLAFGRFTGDVSILKDKRRGPGRRHSEIYRGPDGLC